jgi:hypothetical protein
VFVRRQPVVGIIFEKVLKRKASAGLPATPTTTTTTDSGTTYAALAQMSTLFLNSTTTIKDSATGPITANDQAYGVFEHLLEMHLERMADITKTAVHTSGGGESYLRMFADAWAAHRLVVEWLVSMR